MSAADWIAVRLTAELAALTTVLLLIVGTPIAWWLARTRSAGKPLVASLVAMPLVLPPSVLGFYLLLLMGPQGPVGRLTQALGLGLLPFSRCSRPSRPSPSTHWTPLPPCAPGPGTASSAWRCHWRGRAC